MKDKIKEKLEKEIEEIKPIKMIMVCDEVGCASNREGFCQRAIKCDGKKGDIDYKRVIKTKQLEQHEETKKAERERIREIARRLNDKFRADNTPQTLSGDEFNDVWEEELIKKLGEKEE